MNEALVQTSRIGTGHRGDGYRPELGEYYNIDITDVSDQQDPAIDPMVTGYFVVQITCDDNTLSEIYADSKYIVLEAHVVEDPGAPGIMTQGKATS